MNYLRTIETSAGNLVRDIKDLYCESCEGKGELLEYVMEEGYEIPDRTATCWNCEGKGFIEYE